MIGWKFYSNILTELISIFCGNFFYVKSSFFSFDNYNYILVCVESYHCSIIIYFFILCQSENTVKKVIGSFSKKNHVKIGSGVYSDKSSILIYWRNLSKIFTRSYTFFYIAVSGTYSYIKSGLGVLYKKMRNVGKFYHVKSLKIFIW